MKTLGGIITALHKLDEGWNDKYMLFADNGNLKLVRRSDGFVISEFDKIVCDGGEPDHVYVDGNEYIKRD